MPMPTLKDLSGMADQLSALERQAEQATQRADRLRTCGGHKHIGEWFYQRVNDGYTRNDYDGYLAAKRQLHEGNTPEENECHVLNVTAKRSARSSACANASASRHPRARPRRGHSPSALTRRTNDR